MDTVGQMPKRVALQFPNETLLIKNSKRYKSVMNEKESLVYECKPLFEACTPAKIKLML